MRAFLFPGQGSQKVGMGARAADASPRRRVRGGGRRARLQAVEALLRGAGGGADADRATRSRRSSRRARGRLRVLEARRGAGGRAWSPATRSASTRRSSCAGALELRRRGAPRAPARQVHAGGGARRARARWPRSSASTRSTVAAACREARTDASDACSAGELQRRRPGRDRRAQGAPSSAPCALAKQKGAKLVKRAGGARAVPLRADAAGGRAAGARSSSASKVAPLGRPGGDEREAEPNTDPSRVQGPAGRAGDRRRCAGRSRCRSWRRWASTEAFEVGPGSVLAGLVQAHRPDAGGARRGDPSDRERSDDALRRHARGSKGGGARDRRVARHRPRDRRRARRRRRQVSSTTRPTRRRPSRRLAEDRGRGRRRRAVALRRGRRARPSTRRSRRSPPTRGGSTSWSTTPGIAIDGLLLGAKDDDWQRTHRRQPDGRLPLLPRGARATCSKAKEAGRIINITSVVGEMGNAGQVRTSRPRPGSSA